MSDDDPQAEIDSLRAQLTQEIATSQRLRARVLELEALLAPPPQDSSVVTVTYSDGRVKYAAQDGNKYPMVSDAAHRNKVLALMKVGLGEPQAEVMLQHGDEVLRALTS